MGSQYGGLAANVTGAVPAAVNISSSSAANPAVITTSGAHNLLNGETVSINGHGPTNFVVNGTWVATILSSNTFSIPVAGTGVGGANGTVQSLRPGASAVILGDGDSGSAANLNNPTIADLDRTAFLASLTGTYKMVSTIFAQHDNSAGADWATLTTSTTGTYQAFTGTNFAVQNNGTLQPNDLIWVDLDTSIAFDKGTQSPSFAMVALFGSQEPPGASPLYSKISGSGRLIPTQLQTSPITQNVFPIHLSGFYIAGVSGTGLVELVGLWSTGSPTGNVVFHAMGDYLFRAIVYRPTGWVV